MTTKLGKSHLKNRKASATYRSRNRTPKGEQSNDVFFREGGLPLKSPRWKKQTITPSPAYFNQQMLIPTRRNAKKLVNVFKI